MACGIFAAHAYSFLEYASITIDEHDNTEEKPYNDKGHNKIPINKDDKY